MTRIRSLARVVSGGVVARGCAPTDLECTIIAEGVAGDLPRPARPQYRPQRSDGALPRFARRWREHRFGVELPWTRCMASSRRHAALSHIPWPRWPTIMASASAVGALSHLPRPSPNATL